MEAFEKATRIGISPSKEDYAIGAWRTLFMNYVVGLRYGQPTVLRVDDTNTKKFNPETFKSNYDSLKMILEDHIGVSFSLTPELDSDFSNGSFLVQSQNRRIYQDFTDMLAEQGLIVDDENGSSLLSLDAYIAKYGDTLQLNELNRDSRTINLRAFFQTEKGSDKHIPILAAEGRPLFSIASVVDDHVLNVGTVVRSVKTRDVQVQQDMIRQALSFEPVAHLYLPTWDTPGEKRVGYMDLVKSGIASQAIVSYMASSLWGDSTTIYTDTGAIVESFTVDGVSKSPAQPFEIEKLCNISSRFIKTYKKRGGEVSKLVQGLSEARNDNVFNIAIESSSLLKLIKSENRSLTDIYESISRIIKPQYDDLQDTASKLGISIEYFSQLLREIVCILDRTDFHDLEFDISIEKLIEENGKRVIYSGVRYVISGSCDGVHPQYGIDYLREIDALQDRLIYVSSVVEKLT